MGSSVIVCVYARTRLYSRTVNLALMSLYESLPLLIGRRTIFLQAFQ